nr:type II toxin-antitoxin system YhaV family toxin [Verminephrobacter eiseniae]
MEMGLKWREDALSTPHPDMAMRPHYHPVPSSPFSWGYTMATVFDVESTLTGRYQTTVPETVRCALDLGKRDKIHYIPQDPGRPEYRQGNALGNAYKHWFRAKLFQQYRLFFQFHAPGKMIVLAWVNDEDSKRACGSGNDAYRVFGQMRHSGHPPDDWEQLLLQARARNERLAGLGNPGAAGSGSDNGA